MVDDIGGALVLVVPHGLMRGWQIAPGHDGGLCDVKQAGGDHVVHARHLVGIAQVRAKDRRRRHQDSALARPYLRRIESVSAAGHLFAVDNTAGEGLDQRRADTEGVVAGAFEDQVGCAARVVGAAQERTHCRAEGLERSVLEVAHTAAEGLDVLLRVGQPGHGRRPVEVLALAAANVFERHHAHHRIFEAQRLHELALRIGAGGHHGARTDRADRFDHLQSGGVEQLGTVRSVVEQHGLASAGAGTLQHGFGRRAARLATESEVVARRRAIEGQRAALGQQLETARKRRLAGMRDDIVRQSTAVLAPVLVQQWLARGFPAGRVILGNRRVQTLEPWVGAIECAHRALRADEARPRLARHPAGDRQASPGGTLERFQPGAGGRSFDEQGLAGRDLQRGEQGSHDRAQVQDVGARLLKRQVGRKGVQLRTLGDQKLGMAAGAGFVALDRKAHKHRVATRQRAEQVGLARVHRNQIAHLQAALALGLAAQRRDQRHTARAGDLHVLFVIVEGRDRNAGQCPDVVEVDLGGQHVDQRLVRQWRLHRHDELDLAHSRLAEARLAGGRVARHAKSELPLRKRRHAGVERGAEREQLTSRQLLLDPRRMLSGHLDRAAPDWQGRALFIHELLDAGLAAFRVDHGLRKQLGLDRQALVQALGPAGADGLQCAVTCTTAAGPLQLRVHLLQVLVSQRSIERQRRGCIPRRQAVVAVLQRTAEHAVCAAAARTCAQKLADARVRRRDHVGRGAGQFIDHAQRQRLIAADIAPAQDQVQRIAQAVGAATAGQQARQPLRAAVAG